MNKAVQLFLQAKEEDYLDEYEKFGNFEVSPIKKGTKVETIIDGKRETINVAGDNDVLVKGLSGEQYIISREKLKSRYEFMTKIPGKGNKEKWKAKGKCWAVKYNGPSFHFTAPWDEDMICENGDYICSTRLDGKDVYRIEKNIFKKSYRPIRRNFDD